MPVKKSILEQVLEDKFPNAIIKVEDLAGDENHYSLEIKDSIFNNLSILNQHKLVKNALSNLLADELHAITIKTIPNK